MTAVRGRNEQDGGAVTLFVIGLTVGALALAGLLVDGGLLLASRRAAVDTAGNAARAAAQAVDPGRLRTAGATDLTLAAADATTAAAGYLEAAGWDGAVAVDGGTVTVTATRTVELAVLDLFGLADPDVSGAATARLLDDPGDGRGG